MSNGCTEVLLSAAIPLPGEAEAGSAGKQPAKEYPGFRCAKGVLDPGRDFSARVDLPTQPYLDIGTIPPKIHSSSHLKTDTPIRQMKRVMPTRKNDDR